jgi:hypothetical protein
MNGAGMRHFFDSLAATGWTGDQLLFGLRLKIFEARKPTFKLMLFLANKVVDDHTILQSMNKFVLAGCQGSRDLLAMAKQEIAVASDRPTADLPLFPVA